MLLTPSTIGAVQQDPIRRTFKQASLDLRFAENKSLVDAVSSANLITFTRASQGTYVDSDGLLKTAASGVPRFDHSPTTGESLGLLVEEQRVNFVLNSSPATSGYVLSGAVADTVDNVVAPDGQQYTVRRVSFPSFGGYRFGDTLSGTAGTTYTGSVWMRTQSGTQTVVIDVNDGPQVTVTVTQDWQRFSIAGANATQPFRFFDISAGNNKVILLWGAQIEEGSFPTSYIPTGGSAVTRAADVASIEGVNFSSWYQQSGGSLFTHSARQSIVPTGEFPVAASLNDGTSDNRINNSFITAPLAGLVVSNGGANIASIYPAVTALDRKFATAFATDDFAASANGGAVLTDTSGALPVVNRLRIGDMTGANALNGTIRRLVYWGQRLPNNVLQAITQ